MSPLDDRLDSSRPVRGRRLLVNLAWLGLGVVLTWGLLANPLGLSSLDGLPADVRVSNLADALADAQRMQQALTELEAAYQL